MIRQAAGDGVTEKETCKVACLMGKGIQDILDEAKQSVAEMESGTLFISGGNSSGELGPEKTAKLPIKRVKEIKEGRKEFRVAVVGIMRRPRVIGV